MRTLLTLLVLFSTLLQAGEQYFTMEEAILGSQKQFKIKNLKQIQWQKESNSFTFLDSLEGTYGLIQHTVEDQPPRLLISLDSLQRLLSDFEEPPRTFPKYNWIDKNTLQFIQNKQIFSLNVNSGLLLRENSYDSEGENADIHESSKRIAYTIGQNLYISYTPENQIQITYDTAEGISNGNSYVHRSEFGIRKGTYWSPKANYLAYYRLNQSMVSNYPLVHITERPALLETTRYPMAGMSSEQARVGIYNLKTGSTVFLQTGEPKDQYLTNITWSPDEKYIYISHLNRDQNHLRLVQYDVLSGKPLKTVIDEKNKKWIEPDSGPRFLHHSSEKFIWHSKRDGFNHLYLYSIDGEVEEKLTRGIGDVIKISDISPNNKILYFTAASKDGMNRYAYKSKISNGTVERISKSEGLHTILLSPSGEYLIDSYNSARIPKRIELLNQKGTRLKTLLDAPNPIAAYELGDVQFIKIKNRENIELNARIITPPNFDPEKKYPVIFYLYGGPHGQMITNHWMTGWRLWFQYMAQKGYIVFSLDNRGTNNRGLEFEQAIHRRLGTVELEDQLAGIKHLKSLAWVDTTRMGIHGWSYGGFLTISMLTRQPGIFKAGVAGGPVIDWRYYEVMYGERYMDTPLANPEGYEKANLLNYVANLDAKLLIIHGTVDPVVVGQNSLKYLREAINQGKQLDYFVYPEDEHNMRGMDRVHLYQKISDYFELHL